MPPWPMPKRYMYVLEHFRVYGRFDVAPGRLVLWCGRYGYLGSDITLLRVFVHCAYKSCQLKDVVMNKDRMLYREQ